VLEGSELASDTSGLVHGWSGSGFGSRWGEYIPP
jgi:hypothetical protein